MDGQSIQPTRRRPCQGNPHGHRPGTLAALALMRACAALMHPRPNGMHPARPRRWTPLSLDNFLKLSQKVKRQNPAETGSP